jgi:hypothetical protein
LAWNCPKSVFKNVIVFCLFCLFFKSVN